MKSINLLQSKYFGLSFADSMEPSSDQADLPSFDSFRFIDFEVFKKLKEFPRYPTKDVTCSFGSIARDESLIVFVSHGWLRGCSGTAGWDGTPHPDTASADKFKLCVQGILVLKEKYASRVKHCYIWLDYSCLNQIDRSSIPRELKRFDQIMGCCDIVLTPIIGLVDQNFQEEHEFQKIQSPLWNGGPQAYLNRAWCRVEMMYAAHVPPLKSSGSSPRHELFDGKLSQSCKINLRPHFLVSYQYEAELSLFKTATVWRLCPLEGETFGQYNPLQGNLTEQSDEKTIKDLIDALYNKFQIGYNGDVDRYNRPHGWGIQVDRRGGRYEGEFKNGAREGKGKEITRNGEEYDGDWVDDRKHGFGIGIDANGHEFAGEFKKGVRSGEFKERFARGVGDIEGVYEDGELNGVVKVSYDGFSTEMEIDKEVGLKCSCENMWMMVYSFRWTNFSIGRCLAPYLVICCCGWIVGIVLLALYFTHNWN